MQEVGGTCSKHGVREKCLQSFGWEASREEATGKTYEYLGGEH
jgi:hypothetical protein